MHGRSVYRQVYQNEGRLSAVLELYNTMQCNGSIMKIRTRSMTWCVGVSSLARQWVLFFIDDYVCSSPILWTGLSCVTC